MTTVAYSTTTDLSFKNLGGLAKVTLTGSATITKITITSADGSTILAGAGTVAMDYTDSPALTMTGSTKYVSLNSTNGITLDATGKTFFFALPPCTMNGIKLTVEDKAGRLFTKIGTTSCTINRAKVTNLGTVACELVTKYYGKANSIIVPSGTSSTTFDVTPYYTTSITHDYDNLTNSSLTKATSASLLWRETALTVGNVAYNSATQEVTVSGISGVGNAVVAIKDADGTILWSFHIWVTDQPAEITYTNAAAKTFKILDRALGATSTVAGNVQTAGLYYQWGRKDPIGRTNALSGTSFLPTTGTEFTRVLFSATTPPRIVYATQHPTISIGNSVSPNDWYSDGNTGVNDYLWGNPEGYNYSKTGFVEPSKSVYDPCPAGYKVAPRDIWTAFNTINFTWDEETKGRTYISGGVSDYYPAAGSVSYVYLTLTQVGKGGKYWTSSPSSLNSAVGGCLDFINTNYLNTLSYALLTSGYLVRCVSE